MSSRLRGFMAGGGLLSLEEDAVVEIHVVRGAVVSEDPSDK
jgi:hypothetical protein